ncbi:hypothetical protein EG240_11610 [Paenimyroides tangerinum]|uniref:Uncharacterized protein n=1 Tax=Paenimyroides tangerinum TaxID=2488728 RepID=A0A3P3W3Y1_9FLAO|nr:hypothetical protein [Paenimyroides tangerinum]RRJ89444.1 hypothetical protein EG240_11610 [Paenimyroides tangerinum]
MALYYNISNLNERHENDAVLIQINVKSLVLLAEVKLIKIEKAISKKKYDKVLKHVSKLNKFLVLFEIDECLEYAEAISMWADNQGSKKAIEEVFKVYKVRIEKVLKEMKRDFKIVSST